MSESSIKIALLIFVVIASLGCAVRPTEVQQAVEKAQQRSAEKAQQLNTDSEEDKE